MSDDHSIIHPLVDMFLFDPSCAPDPPSAARGEAQARLALNRIEAELGFDLVEDTRENIRRDVQSIWQ